MRIIQVTPIFRIFDETRAREFYLDFLGFEVEFEHRFAENMPLYMGVKLGEFILHLSEHSGDATPGSAVYIEMKGLRNYHSKLQAKNYKYYKPGICETPWGTIEMGILDPFHNRLSFNERI
jgi:hypothetical protein